MLTSRFCRCCQSMCWKIVPLRMATSKLSSVSFWILRARLPAPKPVPDAWTDTLPAASASCRSWPNFGAGRGFPSPMRLSPKCACGLGAQSAGRAPLLHKYVKWAMSCPLAMSEHEVEASYMLLLFSPRPWQRASLCRQAASHSSAWRRISAVSSASGSTPAQSMNARRCVLSRTGAKAAAKAGGSSRPPSPSGAPPGRSAIASPSPSSGASSRSITQPHSSSMLSRCCASAARAALLSATCRPSGRRKEPPVPRPLGCAVRQALSASSASPEMPGRHCRGWHSGGGGGGGPSARSRRSAA
mmetsp:Transcript_102033/g.312061  ORF Transcript_102033/g.312061 Transcript_102033/m.312061 type:complete len:301 (-) Transcript_102033:78-980(-)